jgi:prolyl-tRNA synthetase
MRATKLFPKTIKEAPKDADSINHKLLVRAGFIDQLMAGSWTLLPLGFRVVNKIIDVIREEMNAIGGQEMLMPLLTPRSIWDETGRWDKTRDIMYQFSDTGKKDFGLAFTHEEIMMDLLKKKIRTYRDLPVYLYHFSTKFRNEPRARSGILRGREFLMKDLYSAHTSEADLMEYYETVKRAYAKIFHRLGFDFRVIEASGGVFTENFTHEFQVLAEGGEDTIYYCDQCGWGQNKEIFTGKLGDVCPKCKKGKIIQSKSIEVGNIFPQGKWYAEKMKATFVDEKGNKQPIWFGSYGIGPSRTLGAWVEVSHDDKGIIWNQAMTPFDAHLVALGDAKAGEDIYHQLEKAGIDVLWDERDMTAGQKFADADLIGIPVRLVVSPKTGDKIEWKNRTAEKTELLSAEKVISRLKDNK